MSMEIKHNISIKHINLLATLHSKDEEPSISAFHHLTKDNKRELSSKIGDTIDARMARHVLIVSQWRSGSSFMGDLLNSYPGTFYFFEPILAVNQYVRYDDNSHSANLVANSFKCQPGEQYLKAVAVKHQWLIQKYNFRFWNTCSQSGRSLPPNNLCFSQNGMKQICGLFPIRLIKVLRMRPAAVEKLLQDPELNSTLKVIYLFRDPISIMNSRHKLDWCNFEECSNVTRVCDATEVDRNGVYQLKKKYPGILHILYSSFA